MNGAAPVVGNVMVATTENGGHSPEFYAERITARLISVSENAPPPIKAQALQYQESMRLIVYDGVKRAIRSDRATLAIELKAHGMHEAAALVLGK